MPRRQATVEKQGNNGERGEGRGDRDGDGDEEREGIYLGQGTYSRWAVNTPPEVQYICRVN